ncbi:hypothetical protein B0H14DRAFT_3564665 [Mycena olivaceomarginata]|nr:hypothetical protein B0H14DRAFT_3564665 [Mycena olivaceomarginata]
MASQRAKVVRGTQSRNFPRVRRNASSACAQEEKWNRYDVGQTQRNGMAEKGGASKAARSGTSLVPEEPNKENRLCVSNIDLKDGAVRAGWADLEMMVESKRTRNNRTDSSEHHRTAASPSVKLQDFKRRAVSHRENDENAPLVDWALGRMNRNRLRVSSLRVLSVQRALPVRLVLRPTLSSQLPWTRSRWIQAIMIKSLAQEQRAEVLFIPLAQAFALPQSGAKRGAIPPDGKHPIPNEIGPASLLLIWCQHCGDFKTAESERPQHRQDSRRLGTTVYTLWLLVATVMLTDRVESSMRLEMRWMYSATIQSVVAARCTGRMANVWACAALSWFRRGGVPATDGTGPGVIYEAQLMDVTDASWQAEEDSLPTGLPRGFVACSMTWERLGSDGDEERNGHLRRHKFGLGLVASGYSGGEEDGPHRILLRTLRCTS